MKVKLMSTDLDQTGLKPDFLERKCAVIPNIFIFSLPLPQENDYFHSKNDYWKETLHVA